MVSGITVTIMKQRQSAPTPESMEIFTSKTTSNAIFKNDSEKKKSRRKYTKLEMPVDCEIVSH